MTGEILVAETTSIGPRTERPPKGTPLREGENHGNEGTRATDSEDRRTPSPLPTLAGRVAKPRPLPRDTTLADRVAKPRPLPRGTIIKLEQGNPNSTSYTQDVGV